MTSSLSAPLVHQLFDNFHIRYNDDGTIGYLELKVKLSGLEIGPNSGECTETIPPNFLAQSIDMPRMQLKLMEQAI